ncbi:MAG: 4Fe-4S dicluster domain-containing protein [Gammaproteobacteria bacterium]|nr:4Fe-4S dicluster domain-containing protein [Gammaproteobacteria bacterium]
MSHANCHGCSLCLLSCPMWQQHRDVQYSPQGIFKALQHNASYDDISSALFSCLLCGACDILCPENIDITATIKTLRKESFSRGIEAQLNKKVTSLLAQPSSRVEIEKKNTIILPGKALRSNPVRLIKIQSLLSNETDASLSLDDGDDIALALEVGVEIPEHRLHRFLEPLQGAKRLYVSNGHLLKSLRQWLPASELLAPGHRLSQLSKLTKKLNKNDLYLIEARSFHHDHQQKVTHYDQLRHQQGCQMNLDLQRNAIPTAAGGLNAIKPMLNSKEQLRWILSGRNIQRIIVECAEDEVVMSQISDLPILHIADLMEA